MTRDVQFRIAHTFTDSLARLTGDEQKAAKTTAFDLCPSSYKMEHQSGLSIGGSGSFA